MKGKLFIRTVATLTAVLMTASLFAGCGEEKKAESSTATVESTKVEAPLNVSIMTITTSQTLPDNTNIIWKEMEKRTNTVLDVTFVPNSNYDEKLNVTIAGGSLPDATFVSDPLAANVMTSAKSGAFWDLTNYYKQYSELAKFPEDTWANTRANDGKNYVIPRPRPTSGGMTFLSFRQDWLDKLNLKLPETSEDIYNVLKAFVNNDPDGNGQKDTQGLVSIINANGTNLGQLAPIFSAFTGGLLNAGYFEAKDGGLMSVISNPAFKEAIIFIKKLYDEGLLHKDFATMKSQQMRDAGMAGKVGAIGEGIPGSWVVTDGLKKVIPTGDFTPITYLKTSSGAKFSPKSGGYYGGYVIKKNGVDEAKMKKILELFNKLATEELWELANYGFKDTHFTKDGVAYRQTAQAKTDLVGASLMGQIASREEKYYYAYNAPNTPADRVALNVKRIDEMAEVGIVYAAESLSTDSWAKIEKEFNKKITDQVLKIILGADKIESWDAFVTKTLNDEAYKTAESDMTAAYKLKGRK